MKFFEIFEIKPTFEICQNNLKKKFLELQKNIILIITHLLQIMRKL